MNGFVVVVGLVAVFSALYMFGLHPDKMPRLDMNQENLHALSKQAKREIADGTLANKIIAQEGAKRAAAVQAAREGRPNPYAPQQGQGSANGKFKPVPGATQ